MVKYDGTKCISCGDIFKDGEDIVVCPECGTPYHRACYMREGRCINDELHESHKSWEPHYDVDISSANTTGEPIKCIRCGETNPSGGIFCNKCGMPLTTNRGDERPFNMPPPQKGGSYYPYGNGYGQQNHGGAGQPYMGQQLTFDQNSDIDGVKLGDYARYVGKNPLTMLTNFIRFGKFGGKASINLGALFFPQFYFFYRKMVSFGIVYMLISIILAIPGTIVAGQEEVMGVVLLNTHINTESYMFNVLLEMSSLLSIVVRCISCMFANYWYYKMARRDIKGIRAAYGEAGDEESVKTSIIIKGGVSWAAVLMSFMIYSALNVAVLYAMNAFLA